MGKSISRRRVVITFHCMAIAFALLAASALLDKALMWRSERNLLLAYTTRSPTPTAEGALLLGDSIAEMFPVGAFLPGAVNAGRGGDSIGKIRARYLGELAEVPHEILVLEGGINDIILGLRDGEDPAGLEARILADYRAILDCAREHGRRVIILSICPVTGPFLLPYSRSVPLPGGVDAGPVNIFVIELNAQLRDLEAEYLDLFPFLLDGGELSRRFACSDGYHINTFGYESIAPAILRAISQQGGLVGRRSK